MAGLLSIVGGGVVAIVLALGAGPAGATHGNGNGPPFDLVQGTGEFPFVTPFGPFQVGVEVDGMEKKSTVTGTFAAHIRGLISIDISGSLTCLEIEGNSAVVSGVIEQTNSGLAPVGSGVLAMGIDNGAPGPDGAPVDTVIALPQGRPLFNCPEPLSAGVPLTSGDFTTHDGDFRDKDQP
jgi:hypothetical protein